MREQWPVSVLLADLYARIDDGPGVGQLLVAATREFEEAASAAQQQECWRWWREALDGYARDRCLETARVIVAASRHERLRTGGSTWTIGFPVCD